MQLPLSVGGEKVNKEPAPRLQCEAGVIFLEKAWGKTL
jgi:hypothetical protein